MSPGFPHGREPLGGQTVVMIGEPSSIGLETARCARADGAHVILAARDADRLRSVGKELQASIMALDVTDADRVERFFDELLKPIDHVLVTGPGPYYAPLAEFDLDDARHDADARRWPALHIARSAMGRIRAGGTLLFIGGTGGRRPVKGLTLIGPLTAALPALTRSRPRELVPISGNPIAAGFVTTPLPAASLDAELDERLGPLRTTFTSRRLVGPADVAALAMHLMTRTAITAATFDTGGRDEGPSA
jgi:NAD(P)-dependent dehydrogenase (short-subunit alcohol dehydrogenase family)